ncbi:MAG: hypothetical protein HFJ28_05250 [Clostridia bacterium]|nr:hypothetical protein [Clostridia bacterium]
MGQKAVKQIQIVDKISFVPYERGSKQEKSAIIHFEGGLRYRLLYIRKNPFVESLVPGDQVMASVRGKRIYKIWSVE